MDTFIVNRSDHFFKRSHLNFAKIPFLALCISPFIYPRVAIREIRNVFS